MILPDLNLVIYAYNVDAPAHLASRSWWWTGTMLRLITIRCGGSVRIIGTGHCASFGRRLSHQACSSHEPYE